VGPVYTTIYPVTGLAVDYFYAVTGIKYVYNFELRPEEESEYGFVLPPEQIEPNAREVWAFHARIAELLLEEYA